MKRSTLLPIVIAAAAGFVAGSALSTGRAQDRTDQQSARDAARNAAYRAADEAAPPRSAKDVRGHTPYFPIENEPPPKLIVDEALPDLLDKGVLWVQYRTENCRILPVFGKAALDVSPRVGHLHVHLDDLPWLWADASDLNTVDVAGLPPGDHKITIELVDAAHQPFPGQAKTVKFTIPKSASASH